LYEEALNCLVIQIINRVAVSVRSTVSLAALHCDKIADRNVLSAVRINTRISCCNLDWLHLMLMQQQSGGLDDVESISRLCSYGSGTFYVC